jgi:hypothetical protein
MIRSAGSRPRVVLMPVVLLCLTLMTSVPAAAYVPPADQVLGQPGNHDFRDHAYGSHDGSVDCDYRQLSTGVRKIKRFVIRAPLAWWPDMDSGKPNEHGTVGWRFRLQTTSHPGGSWSTVFTSAVQKRTAHEDQPAHDLADKAPFTARSLDWSVPGTADFRVKVTISWYRSNGSVMGTASHWYYLYDVNYATGPVGGFCRNRIFPI